MVPGEGVATAKYTSYKGLVETRVRVPFSSVCSSEDHFEVGFSIHEINSRNRDELLSRNRELGRAIG